MTCYNCAKVCSSSFFSFGVSMGGGGGQNDPTLGTNVSENTLGFLGLKTQIVS